MGLGAAFWEEGLQCFRSTEESRRWAEAAFGAARHVASDPRMRASNLRHGETWFVGVDALPNAADGSVDGVPLAGGWQGALDWHGDWHKAQLSIVYPGYPKRDAQESEGNHRYRKLRKAAHVDGLLPIGNDRRRYPREFHAFILGVPLNLCAASPTVVWKGSHHIVRRWLTEVMADCDPREVDVTEAYHAARREVFESCEMVPIEALPGDAFLIHRLALHGTECWDDADPVADGRMIAFFRPELPRIGDWLTLP